MAHGERVTAPHCSNEEVYRLRDQWRPEIQEKYLPPVRYLPDPESDEGEFKLVYRPDGYDTRDTSLSTRYPMYVIPPAIAGPLAELVRERFVPKHFGGLGDRQQQIIRGAGSFVREFFPRGPGHSVAELVEGEVARNVPADRMWASNSNVIHVNFDENGPNYTSTAPIPDPFIPELTLAAPVLERRIPHIEETVPYYESERFWDRFDYSERSTADFDAKVDQTRSVEGVLGWTIPRGDSSDHFVWSLLLAKDHLVQVSWFDFPAENLRLQFRYPQLSKAGGVMLRSAIAELEPLLPQGVSYDELYMYHPRAGEKDSFPSVWDNTTLHMPRYYNPRPRSGTRVLY